ncbi:MAG: glycosyltransferase family 4 protein [Gammaproteobacteria bacterium]|nr:glycosyltransferase family 4 protein [Gammaproteobacteria bacterium]
MRVLCVAPLNARHETAQFLGLQKKGVDIYVVVAKKVEPDYSELISAGIPVEVIPMRGRLDRPAFLRLREIIKARHIDIIHAFNNKTIVNALSAGRGLPVKFIAYRGIVGNVSFMNPASWLTYLNPRVNRIICVAEAIRQHLLHLRFLWFRIAAEKLVTIHKGHHIDWYNKEPQDLAQYKIPSDAFVVGCAANYRPRKGIEVLIDALQKIPDEENVHILLIGDMSNRHLHKHLAKSKKADKVHLAGYVNNAPEILAACDVCALPSLKREGLPRSIIEGMAYGIPAIVTNSGGSPELVDDGVNGLIVEPGSAKALAEAILKFRHNPEFRKRAGLAARETISTRFTVAQTVEKTYRVYQELYEQKTPDF